MARNQEKAQSMLHRYLRSKGGEGGRGVGGGGGHERRRPYLATLCDDVGDAERWHRQVESEIRRLVEEIQNEGLLLSDEGRVHEMNDKINKLLRERRHWRRRIGELGGGQGKKSEEWRKNEEDEEVFECDGYRYFGAARKLPGVREMIETRRRIRGGFDGDEEGGGERGEEGGNEYGWRKLKEMKEKADAFYFKGVPVEGEGEGDGKGGGDGLAVRRKMESEMERGEDAVVGRLIEQWEKEHDGDEKYTRRYGADAPWDEAFLEFVGRRVTDGDAQEAMKGVALERKKLEALEEV